MVQIQLDEAGLVPAIVQNANTGEVLMLGYVSPGSLRQTLKGGDVWFYSRSRSDLWHKGETSGNYLRLKVAAVDCDRDTILLQVEPEGPTCHTGNSSCFSTTIEELPDFARQENGSGILEELFAVIQDRKHGAPKGSYTARLFEEGVERIGQKVLEEADEVVGAGMREGKGRVVEEVADLIYHTLVMLSVSDATPEAVWEELRQRRK